MRDFGSAIGRDISPDRSQLLGNIAIVVMKNVLYDRPVGCRHRHEEEKGGPDGKEQDQPKRDGPGAAAIGGRGESVSDLFDSKDIADAADGMKHLRREGIIDLGPQTSHHDIDDVGAGIEVNVPDLFHDFGP